MKISRKTSSEMPKKLKECKLQYARLAKEFVSAKKQSEKLSQLLFVHQEDDRKEISRKLHDEIAQMLTGINFKLSILTRTTANCTPELRDKIIDAQQLVERSVEKINDFARELHPMILDDLGLVMALESYIKAFMKKNDMKVKLKTSINLSDLSEINKIVLFRVAQESLTNISKHSKACKVSIVISKVQNRLQMVVHDNGVAFKVKNLRAISSNTRIGLIGMEERLKMVNGVFVITSSPNKGTQVKVQIPILKKYL